MARRYRGGERGLNKRGQSFGDQWYLEQTLKLRATKISKHDSQIITYAKLESLITILRYTLVVFMFFDTILFVEDITTSPSSAKSFSVARFLVVMAALFITFVLSFTRVHATRYFFIIAYLGLLVQSTSTAAYLFISTKSSEHSPVNPFLILDSFFVYLFVRYNVVTTLAVTIIAMVINEGLILGLGSVNTFEAGNVVLYLICNVLGLVTGRIFELNMRSKYFLSKEIEKDRASMQSEREKAEKLLYNILPREIADSLKNDSFSLLSKKDTERENEVIADKFDDTTIGFCDICNFTVISGEMNPEKLVGFLNDIFSSFDNLLHEYGLEKIKTIGDAYMFAGGLSKSSMIQTKHGHFTAAEAVAEMALNMQNQVDLVSQKHGTTLRVRVGLSSGSVVAGIVGISKFVYDLFGESVNVASKMESSGQPKRVHVSQETYMKLADKYEFEAAADVEMKERTIKTYFILGRKGHMSVAGRTAATTTMAIKPLLTASPHSLTPSHSPAHSPHSPLLNTSHSSHSSENTPPLSLPRSASLLPPDSPPSELSMPQVVDQVNLGNDEVEVLDPVAHANEGHEAPSISVVGDAIVFTRPKKDSISELSSSRTHLPTFETTIHAKAARSLDSRPTSPANLPLRTHGSLAKLEDAITNDGDNKHRSEYTAPVLSLMEVVRGFQSRPLEIKYRKDYFRKYFRLVQLNSIGSLVLFTILGTMCTCTLPKIDYSVLLGYAIALLLIGIVVGVFFMGDETRTYMHYMPAIQSTIAVYGLLIPAVLILAKFPHSYEHHHLLWNSVIVMFTFMYVFPANPFLHAFVATVPALLAIIISCAVVDRNHTFAVVVRLLMLICLGICIGYRKEQESRSAFFVTHTLDEERRLLTAERSKSEKLLYSILPQKIAAKLKMSEGSIADTFADVTVMFVSIHNFTQITSSLNPFEKVSLLNKIFSKFDKLAEFHKVEKIKTIGPTYLVVGGLPVPRANHLHSICELAIDMQEAISNFRSPDGKRYKIKAGIHCGKVVAGVIGIYKFSYDLWGDTVNTASRMESHSLPGQIQVTEAVQKKLSNRFEFADRGFIQVKGKGVMHTFFLTCALNRDSQMTLQGNLTNEKLPNAMPRGKFGD